MNEGSLENRSVASSGGQKQRSTGSLSMKHRHSSKMRHNDHLESLCHIEAFLMKVKEQDSPNKFHLEFLAPFS